MKEHVCRLTGRDGESSGSVRCVLITESEKWCVHCVRGVSGKQLQAGLQPSRRTRGSGRLGRADRPLTHSRSCVT